MSPYDNVAELEKRVAKYAGAPYAVMVDSCTNAIFLSIKYRLDYCNYPPRIVLPKYTYVGVAQAAKNAGCRIRFVDEDWQGAYELGGLGIVDSARRFKRNMYSEYEGYLYCLSCHWWKHLKIGRGGFILTDDAEAADTLRRMRYDGRRAGVAPKDDDFIQGYHCYSLPEEAARGLMLMADMPDDNPDIRWDAYTDLSKHSIFGGG
jgi:dTDP-4-amino-4,6-dideoxygalactose transaminase